jgi:2-keto-4-pentenoate hydratase
MSTTPDQDERTLVQKAAERLIEAAARRTPCPPVRDLGLADLPTAYAVQRAVNAGRARSGAPAGTRAVGRKIGVTTPAAQAKVGSDEPDYGVLFADMRIRDKGPIPLDRLLQPIVEAEIAFVLGRDLAGEDIITPEQVRGAVDYAAVALEIADSRIADWDITLVDTVADNASAGMFVLGATQAPLRGFEPRKTTMTLLSDDEPVATGVGADCLGDPLNALVWLARTALEHGEPLRAGDIVLSGTLAMTPLGPGQAVEARLATADGRTLGTVCAHTLPDQPRR